MYLFFCVCSWMSLKLLSLSIVFRSSPLFISSLKLCFVTLGLWLVFLYFFTSFRFTSASFLLNISFPLFCLQKSPSSTTFINDSTSYRSASPRPPSAIAEPQEIDLIYQVLKQAGEISSSRSGTARSLTPAPPGNYHNMPMDGTVPPAKQLEQANGTGPAAPSVATFHRRSGPTQQQPLLLRGATSSLTVGPVPHASISGVFVPSMSQCFWCWLDVYVDADFHCIWVFIVFIFLSENCNINCLTYLSDKF